VPFKIQFRDFGPLDSATLDHPALSRGIEFPSVSIALADVGGISVARRPVGRIII
jgi:hypothetical protein